jgi:formate/nitrite transporter FocA (FNT family)
LAATKTVGEILETVVIEGREELSRANTGLALSALGAGLNISFSAIALALVGSLTGGVGLLAMAAYPVGFLIVILGKEELYTENTVTPVAVALTDTSEVTNMLRMWGILFVFNIIGAIAFALVVSYGGVLGSPALDLLLEEVAKKMENGFWVLTLKAVFGGWLVALVAWLVAASQDTISQIFFIWLLVFLIPVGELVHCIAGATEVLISVFAGETSWTEFLFHFLVPATLGNTIGGIVLVTLLNYGQVMGSKVRL